ncbi:MAG TPA: penicillin acylase family protein, partial [Chitinophagaceae bacterium]|nr:penicillin acylase family protein [Chitinophagaceae bacterium]
NTINAMKQDHGPSWRMIVEMGKDKINAYGVYPGGQSGNPGSKYYADFLDYWVEGRYYSIQFR